MNARFHRTLARGADVLSPARCAGCNAPETYLCLNCERDIRDPVTICLFCGVLAGNGVCRSCAERRYITHASWVASYRHQTVRTLIASYKYEGAWSIADALAMASTFFVPPSPEVLWIPIPLFGWKERYRGFNQATLFAEHVARRVHHASPRTDILSRTRNTPPQAQINDTRERTANIEDAFQCDNPDVVRDASVLLIDDVATTGATIAEAARVLHNVGAKEISAFVFARG